MGDEETTFKKTEDFFQSLDKEFKCEIDLNPYFAKKATKLINRLHYIVWRRDNRGYTYNPKYRYDKTWGEKNPVYIHHGDRTKMTVHGSYRDFHGDTQHVKRPSGVPGVSVSTCTIRTLCTEKKTLLQTYKEDQETLIDIYNEMLETEYDPHPFEYENHLFCLWIFYGLIRPCNISINLITRLDLATLTVLEHIGNLHVSYATSPLIHKKLRHINGLLEGNKKQKLNTVKTILKAYKDIGAQWCDDEPQKLPILILLKDEARRISIDNLAGKIFIHLQGVTTQRHINNYLKELREKGEI
ncbi:MAG: hypothetical protein ACD_50C00104G0003 [uncultured bacterium]|nr:MAG: hypothetical protein ACD_50C00104G0003 [uncultured bacterium]